MSTGWPYREIENCGALWHAFCGDTESTQKCKNDVYVKVYLNENK